MEEIKGILLDMQKSQEEMKKEFKQDILRLEQGQEEMKKEFKQEISRLEKRQEEIREELVEKIHEVNQRLAVFQQDIMTKVNILFDADESRKELLEIHDIELGKIKEEQFEHTVRIGVLEKKVIGA